LVERGELENVRDPEVRGALRDPVVTAIDYVSAQRARARLIADLRAMFRQVDALLAYNFPFPWPPPRVDEDFGLVPIAGGNTAMVWAGNLAGLPAVFLPVGLSDIGTPVSIQVVGPPGADALVLAIGMAFQERTGWHRLRPPLAPVH
jgi:aspartyl-tRNA(Asn)/glutamyl-tRNA(Gln) amidotransferase subunit A